MNSGGAIITLNKWEISLAPIYDQLTFGSIRTIKIKVPIAQNMLPNIQTLSALLPFALVEKRSETLTTTMSAETARPATKITITSAGHSSFRAYPVDADTRYI